MLKVKGSTILKIFAALIMLSAVLILGQIYAVGYIYDQKIGQVLKRVESKVTPLTLSYQEQDSSFFKREGILSWEYRLPEDNLFGMSSINGQTKLELRIAPLKVSGAFEPVIGVGNLDKFLSKLNLEPIYYQGAFKATAIKPKVSFAVKTTAFSVPLTLGSCYIGESSFLFEATSLSKILTELNFAGFDCQGNEQYAKQNSFNARLEGLSVRLRPYIEDNKPYLDNIEIALKKLNADISTLFAIGFSPDEKVKDPTLREALGLDNFATRVSFTDKNSQGQGLLKVDATGNLNVAFPSVKLGVIQEPYTFEGFKLNGFIDRINLTQTVQNFLSVKDSSDLPLIMQGLSKPLKVNLNEFSFSHQGNKLHLDATSEVGFKEDGASSSLDLALNFKSHESIVKDFADTFAYRNELKRALENNILQLQGSDYVSAIQVQGKRVIINGTEIQNLQEGEDLVPESEY